MADIVVTENLVNHYFRYTGTHKEIRGKVGVVTQVLDDGFVEFLFAEELYRVKQENLKSVEN